jgi:hypothetical protein
MKETLSEAATAAGAKTQADVGVFLVGAAVGGTLDAVINLAGFAEPFVFAGLTGAGALGLKKLLWDAPREARKQRVSRRARAGD